MTPEEVVKLYFTSQLVMDKILWTDEGSMTIGACTSTFVPSTATKTISHDVGGLAFPLMIWSVDNTTWYPAGTGYSGANGFASNTFQTVEVSCGVGASDILISAKNWTGTGATIYYAIALLGVD